jgi:two-component system cell cycle sensor histidine kinase/response regulator CckA
MQGLPAVGLGTVLTVQAVGQVLGALLLAALVDVFHRVYQRPYLRHWSRSWLALAAYLTAATVSGMSLHAGSALLHVSASTVEAVAGHLQIVWLVLGTAGLALGREVPRRVAMGALVAAALLGLGTSASGGVGGLSALSLRCLLAGLAYLATALALLWSGRTVGGIGRRFMGIALVAWAANQFTYIGFGFLPRSWQVSALTLLGPFDLLTEAAIGLALVTWLLEGEREDLARAVEVTQGQARVQACVYRISEAARSVGNLPDLFRSIHEAISAVLPARNFYIALYDRTSELLSFPYFVDERDPAPAPKPLGRGLTEYVLRTGRPLLATPEVFEALTAAGEVQLIASNSVDWLGAPLVAGGDAIGVVVIQTYDPVVRLGPEERDLFVFMTEQIATAIEAKRTEEALRESEARLRLTIEQVPAILWTTDDQLRFTSSLGAGLTALGLSPNEVVGRSVAAYLGADSPALGHHRRALAGESVSFEHEQDGRFYTVHLEPLRDADAHVRGTIGISADITEERQAHDLVESQARYFRSLIENAHDGITVLDADGTVRFEAPSVERRLGYRPDEVVGLRTATLLHPEDVASLEVAREDLLAGRLPLARRELRMRGKDGSWRVLETVARRFAGEDGRPYLILNSRDVTERKAAEEALRRASKDESLAVLAGGVAHDFNNLLAAMLGHISLALAKLGEKSPARRHLEKAAVAVERASALTRQMLAYSGRGHFVVRPTDLGALVQENLPLLEVAIPKKVRLETRLGGGVPLVDADVGQMQQVVMNLVINAAEAIGERGGTVTVATGLQQVRPGEGARWAVSGQPLPAGTYVKLEVTDDGPGMDEETLGRIFEPFFSTKFTGRGLGLAAVLGVMRGHQGGLSVESEPGRGTSFRLLFAPSAAAASRVAGRAARGRAERLRLLLIDDEEVVRDMVAEVLAHEGLDVLCAEDGARGVAVFRERRAEIDVVLLDLSMPGLSGEETFRRLCEIDPEVCVILSSGYDHLEATRRFGDRAPTGFIQKPYRPAQLLAEIERCRGRRATGGGVPAPDAASGGLDAGGAEK